jgi:hypothetical protein
MAGGIAKRTLREIADAYEMHMPQTALATLSVDNLTSGSSQIPVKDATGQPARSTEIEQGAADSH